MAMQTATVLPSPLLPAQLYLTWARELRSVGIEAGVAPERRDGESADDLVRRWSRAARDATVLIAHSNAGLLAPVVRSLIDHQAPIVFVDAALLPVSGSTRLAPPSFRTMLAGLADERGVLPAWTRWWPREDLDGVVPPGLFDAIDRLCPQLPLSWFDQEVTAPTGWADGADAWLGFGGTYAAEQEFARDHGWPLRVLDGDHLHFLHRPDTTATAVRVLLDELR